MAADLDAEFDIRGTANWIAGLRLRAKQGPKGLKLKDSGSQGAEGAEDAGAAEQVAGASENDGGVRKVALQLPDGLLSRAQWLVDRLRVEIRERRADSLGVEPSTLEDRPEAPGLRTQANGLEVEFYVLADSSVSSWDPDVVAAEHVFADGIVMYGRATASKTEVIPVYHVYHRQAFDLESFVRRLDEDGLGIDGADGKQLIILPSGPYAHLTTQIREGIRTSRPTALVAEIQSENDSSGNSPTRHTCGCGPDSASTKAEDNSCRSSQEQETDIDQTSAHIRYGHFVVENHDTEGGTVVVYIGTEGPELTRLMLEHAGDEFRRYDTSEGKIYKDLLDSSKALKRRYFLMMKTKDAERVGIMVATTAVQGYKDMIHRLKEVIKKSNKIPYTFYVGKINPAKLANFPEIDVFVLIASPENTVSIDASEYYKPLITPMELEIALIRGKEWTGDYNLDFRPLLATPLPELSRDDEEMEEVTQSLTSGALIRHGGGGALTVQTAGQVLANRTFKGLDPNEGIDRPLDVVQGRFGIASGYQHEPAAQNQLSKPKGSIEYETAESHSAQSTKPSSGTGQLAKSKDIPQPAISVKDTETPEVQEIVDDCDMQGAAEAVDDFFDAFD